MIKFFRKIRQQMIKENKVTKYTLYAIGEIVLVVIGILIALQINTWNQEKLLRQKEIKSLTELKNNLDTNVKIFSDFSSRQLIITDRLEKLISYKEAKISYNDSLSSYFIGIDWLEQINLVTSTYETLKTSGLDLIFTDSLRLKIIELHEVRYSHFENFIGRVGLAEYSGIVIPMQLKYTDNVDRYNSKEYLKFLENRISTKKKGYVRWANKNKIETENLIKYIDAELENFKN